MISPVLDIARQGMMQAAQDVSKNAENIASAFIPPEDGGSDADYVNYAVDMKQDILAYKANASVIRTADELSTTAIDLLA